MLLGRQEQKEVCAEPGQGHPGRREGEVGGQEAGQEKPRGPCERRVARGVQSGWPRWRRGPGRLRDDRRVYKGKSGVTCDFKG